MCETGFLLIKSLSYSITTSLINILFSASSQAVSGDQTLHHCFIAQAKPSEQRHVPLTHSHELFHSEVVSMF